MTMGMNAPTNASTRILRKNNAVMQQCGSGNSGSGSRSSRNSNLKTNTTSTYYCWYGSLYCNGWSTTAGNSGPAVLFPPLCSSSSSSTNRPRRCGRSEKGRNSDGRANTGSPPVYPASFPEADVQRAQALVFDDVTQRDHHHNHNSHHHNHNSHHHQQQSAEDGGEAQERASACRDDTWRRHSLPSSSSSESSPSSSAWSDNVPQLKPQQHSCVPRFEGQLSPLTTPPVAPAVDAPWRQTIQPDGRRQWRRWRDAQLASTSRFYHADPPLPSPSSASAPFSPFSASPSIAPCSPSSSASAVASSVEGDHSVSKHGVGGAEGSIAQPFEVAFLGSSCGTCSQPATCASGHNNSSSSSSGSNNNNSSFSIGGNSCYVDRRQSSTICRNCDPCCDPCHRCRGGGGDRVVRDSCCSCCTSPSGGCGRFTSGEDGCGDQACRCRHASVADEQEKSPVNFDDWHDDDCPVVSTQTTQLASSTRLDFGRAASAPPTVTPVGTAAGGGETAAVAHAVAAAADSGNAASGRSVDAVVFGVAALSRTQQRNHDQQAVIPTSPDQRGSRSPSHLDPRSPRHRLLGHDAIMAAGGAPPLPPEPASAPATPRVVPVPSLWWPERRRTFAGAGQARRGRQRGQLLVAITSLLVMWLALLVGSANGGHLVHCGHLLVGQYRCAQPEIDTHTQQVVGCSPNNSAPIVCTLAPDLSCLDGTGLNETHFVSQVPCEWTNGYSFELSLLLSVFLGWLGLDRLYLGYPGLALAKFCTLGGIFLWQLIDIVLIAMQVVRPADGSQFIVAYFGPRLTRLALNNETQILAQDDW